MLLTGIKTKISRDNHLKELLKGGSVSFFIKLAGMGIAYLFTILIARYFGADAMGMFALASVILHIFALIGKLGLDTAFVRFVAQYVKGNDKEKIRSTYFKSLQIIFYFGLFLSIFMFVLAPILSDYVFNNKNLGSIFKIASFGLLPMTLSLLHVEGLRGYKKITEYSLLKYVGVFFFSVVCIWIYPLFGINLNHIPVYSYITGHIFTLLIAVILWLRNFRPWLYSRCPDIHLKKVLEISMPMMFVNSLILVMGWVDIIMVGMYRSQGDVGVYNVAVKMATLTSLPLLAINSIAAPKFSELFSSGKIEEVEKVVQQATKIIFFLTIPIVLVYWSIPGVILGIFGPDFSTGSICLFILALGQFISTLCGPVGNFLQMTGSQKALQRLVLVSVVLNIILNRLLVPVYGIEGAAIATAVGASTWNLLAVHYVYRNYGFSMIFNPARYLLTKIRR